MSTVCLFSQRSLTVCLSPLLLSLDALITPSLPSIVHTPFADPMPRPLRLLSFPQGSTAPSPDNFICSSYTRHRHINVVKGDIDVVVVVVVAVVVVVVGGGGGEGEGGGGREGG